MTPLECTHNVRAVVRNANGAIIRTIEEANMTVTDGLVLITELLQGEGEAITHMAVGDDNTDPALSQSSLVSEFYRDQLTDTSRDGDGGATFILYIGTNDANGNTIREAGLFANPDGGPMFARVNFGTAEEVAKDDTISVEITWDVTFSNA